MSQITGYLDTWIIHVSISNTLEIYMCLKSLDIWIHGHMVDKNVFHFEIKVVSLNPGLIWINGYMLVLDIP